MVIFESTNEASVLQSPIITDLLMIDIPQQLTCVIQRTHCVIRGTPLVLEALHTHTGTLSLVTTAQVQHGAVPILLNDFIKAQEMSTKPTHKNKCFKDNLTTYEHICNYYPYCPGRDIQYLGLLLIGCF